jgi:hypothetical protein
MKLNLTIVGYPTLSTDGRRYFAGDFRLAERIAKSANHIRSSRAAMLLITMANWPKRRNTGGSLRVTRLSQGCENRPIVRGPEQPRPPARQHGLGDAHRPC